MVTSVDPRLAGQRRTAPGPDGHPWAAELLACGLGVVALTVLAALVAWLATGQGVLLGGDEPTYVVQAQALLHGTTLIGPFIHRDLVHHLLASPSRSLVIETYPSAHGVISPFAPGTALLLAPFVAIGPARARCRRRDPRSSPPPAWSWSTDWPRGSPGCGVRGQALLGVVLASPAVLVAMGQIYPDLLSGIVLAGAALEIALLEVRGEAHPVHVVVVAASSPSSRCSR